MRIAFITKDFTHDDSNIPIPNGSAYYRCALPMYSLRGHQGMMGTPAWLPERGFGIVTGPKQAEFGFPVAVLKLLMGSEIPHQIRGAQAIGQKIVIDIDDHYEEIHPENLAHAATDPSKRRTWNRDNYAESIRLADLVTVSTPFLYDYYKSQGLRVQIIRNGINPDMFQTRQQQTRPVIGWAGAIPWRSNDLAELDWLPAFLEDHDLAFHHLGATPDATVADRLGIPAERFTSAPIAPLSTYPKNLITFDIGLVPLTDIPFNHAKSALKGMEYAASNIPFVASSLPEYRELAASGVGRVASTPSEWQKHLTELIPLAVRRQEATRQRSIIRSDHSIWSRADEWNDALTGL